MVLTHPLPFAAIEEFLQQDGVDVKALKSALIAFSAHCGEELAVLDHYAEPERWLEAVGYREAVDEFVQIL